MEETNSSVTVSEIDTAMDLIRDLCDMNSISSGALLAASFNIVCRIMQDCKLPDDSIMKFGEHFESCMAEISAKVITIKMGRDLNDQPGKM